MQVTCPHGHTSEIMDPNTDVPQLVGVVNGVEQFDVVIHDAVIVECSYREYDDTGQLTFECKEHFEHEIGAN